MIFALVFPTKLSTFFFLTFNSGFYPSSLPLPFLRTSTIRIMISSFRTLTTCSFTYDNHSLSFRQKITFKIRFHNLENQSFIFFLYSLNALLPPGKDLSKIACGWSGKTWDFFGCKTASLMIFRVG